MLLLVVFQLMAQQTLESKVDSIVNLMSVSDKIQQLINNGFMTTPTNSTIGIPGFIMNDGPHGNRFDVSVSFPVGIAIASTFDRHLAFRVGKAMGEEFWGWNKDVQLGPCIDLCRDPRNGRSGETGGEDPYLAGEIGTEVIKGIQKSPVIATIKHYNCQNKEDYRHNLNALVSERNLMEHYGLNFKKAVQDGGNMALMSAYNLINGEKSAESYNSLTTILRERWGFSYFVMSDWGGIWNSEKAIEAGNDVCMGSDNFKNDLQNLYNSGAVSEATITKSAKNVIRTKLISGMLETNRPVGSNDLVGNSEHIAVCKEAGQKAMILLKNKDNILPLKKTTLNKILLVGPSANKAQLDGFGSAWVNATYTVSPKQGIEDKIGASKVDYTLGCPISEVTTIDFANAKAKAATADVVVFVGGLDDTMEGEGYGTGGDRKNGTVTLPSVQVSLINELAAINPNIIVVLNSGGVCAVNPFVNNIKGLIYAFYPGQEGGNALADVLFGDYNPAGRLPVTMPKNDAQIQTTNDDFNDDFLCGYRYNDQINQTPEFTFGFGLSYTTFTYSNIVATGTSPIIVRVDITNTGSVGGEDVPQLYLTDDNASVWMPKKQLKGFERVLILPGETKTVAFELLAEDFQYWNSSTHKYSIEAGTFTAKVGPSSDNLPLSVTLNPSAMIGIPDLVITNVVSYPRYPIAGQKVNFYATVVNKGDAATTAGVANSLTLTIDGNTVTGSTSESIPAGGMKLVTLSTNSWISSLGTFVATATVDSQNIISEATETNNSYSFDYKVSVNANNPSNNLCLNKPVVVSSTEGNYIGSNAVDGSFGTRWSSLAKNGEYLIVDLQDSYDINKIKIYWEAAFASSYRIDIAADQAAYLSDIWTNIVTVTGSTGGNKTHNIVATCRYIRIMCVTRGTTWGNSFYEIQAFGNLIDPVSSCEVDSYTLPAQIEAECYQAMSGIQLETCTDFGGGQNVGYFDLNDWIEYKVIAPNTLKYVFNFRSASLYTEGKLQIWVDGVNLKQVVFPITGSWQTYATTNTTLELTKGPHVIRFVSLNERFNINWIEITHSIAATSLPITYLKSNTLDVFPNPSKKNVTLFVNNGTIQQVALYDIKGTSIFVASSFENNYAKIDMLDNDSGIYFFKVLTNNGVFFKKVIKI